MKTFTQEEIMQEIRGTWFGDHKAKLVEKGPVSWLLWKEPGTSMYSVKYVFFGRNLFISGDLGEAVFDLTWNATLESFKDINLSYLMRKLSCSSRERWSFNDSLAKKELNEYFEDRVNYNDDPAFIEEAKEVKEAIEGAIHESTSCSGMEFWTWNAYHDLSLNYFDSEDFSMFSRFGQEMPWAFIAYLEGLKMALEQLKGVEANERKREMA